VKVGRKRKTARHLPERVYIKHGQHYYVDPKSGKWIKLAAGFADAMVKYSQLVDKRASKTDMDALWDRYKSVALQDNAKATQDDKIKSWGELKPAFGECEPDGIRPQDIAGYLDLRGTVRANREIALLSHMYTKAIRWGMASFNPCRGVERNKEAPRKLYVTDEMLTDWLDFAPPMLAAYSEFAYLTGLRKTDIINLTWSDATKAGITFTARKTNKAGIVTKSDDLDDVIAKLKGLRKNGKVTKFTQHLIHGKGGRRYSVSGFNTAWQRAMSDYPGKRFAPNDLRAKHATDLEAQGGDATKNLQHSSRQVTARHYLRKPQTSRL